MGNRFKKSNLRKIVVNNEEYLWGIGNYNCDGDFGSKFQIFKDKKKVYLDIIHGETVTPKTVREIILKLDE